MKILLISSEYPFGADPRFGGGGSHVFYLALSLAQIGEEVFILAYKGANKMKSPLEGFANVEVFPCDFGTENDIVPVKALEEAQRICKNHKPDVIHGHHLHGGFIGLTVATAYKLPMVLTMHKPPKLSRETFSVNLPLYQRSRFYALWHLLATDERIKAHIAYSKIYKQENLDVGVPEDKIAPIPHGVPVQYLQHKVGRLPKRSRFGYNPEDIVIVCPLRPEKSGVDVFIKAASIVQQRIGKKYKLRFIITGNPKPERYRDRYNAEPNIKLARSLGLNQDLMIFRTFTLRQMWELFNRAKICVIPSYREGLSIALLEAMALGTPVVASDVHGINEVIVDGTTGLLVPPGQFEDLAEKVVHVLTEKNLANFLVENAKQRMAQEFSAEKMAEKYIALYRTLA